MAETEKVTLNGMFEPVDGQTDSEKEKGAANDFPDDGRGGFESAFRERQVRGDSHDKEEEGKNEVARGQTIPLRVGEHLVRLAMAIIDQYHTRDRNAAEDIE